MTSSPAVLWIPGWGCCADPAWQPTPATPYPTVSFAGCACPDDLVNRVIDTARQQSTTVLAGWSLGGMLALAAAAQLPQLTKLVLIGTGPVFCSNDDAPGWSPEVLARMSANCRLQPERARATFFTIYLPKNAATADSKAADADSLCAGLDTLATWDLRAEAAKLTLPVLWIHGDADRLFPAPTEEQAATALPAAKLQFHRLPGVGHAPFVDRPEQCQQLIHSFLT